MSYLCGTCGRTFPAGWKARQQHCDATGHSPPPYECSSCPRWFNSDLACRQHMSNRNHFPYQCELCDETWPSEEELQDHEVQDHFYCANCDRDFNTLNGIGRSVQYSLWAQCSTTCLDSADNSHIMQHLRNCSSGDENINCPFCKLGFTSAASVVVHLESGGYRDAGFINKREIYRFVRTVDPEGLLTKNCPEETDPPHHYVHGQSVEWSSLRVSPLSRMVRSAVRPQRSPGLALP